MKILGISCWYHDSAVAFIENGIIKNALQEERFTRKKHDPNFPLNSILWILDKYNLKINDFDYIAFYEDPNLKFKRIKYTHSINWPFSFEKYLKDMDSQEFKISIKRYIRKKLKFKGKFFICKHHISHAASAFYPSPFSKAAILTIDGVGEYETTTFGIGSGKNIDIKKRVHYPHSLGLLYSAFTYYCGFKVNSGEYKLMGLAPYGRPIYKELILDNLVDVKEDGSFRLNMKYFGHFGQDVAINNEFEKLFKNIRRAPESEISNFYINIASSIQNVLEEIFISICSFVKDETELDNLCLAGGVALNCVANGKLLKKNLFENLWIQPAAGDAGGALGAALYCSNQKYNNNSKKPQFMSPYLGPEFKDEDIEIYLKKNKINFLKTKNITEISADLLSKGKIIGWFQGGSEFGPRSLGNRSILGNPLIKDMQKNINLKVKFRESFRPFAPVILEEYLHEWFDLNTISSPYMLLVSKLNKTKLLKDSTLRKYNFEDLAITRSLIPAVTHVDCSARIQTITAKQNYLLYDLISKFNSITNCPVLINTSFNVRGEPIVLTPDDAFRCFMMTNIDYLSMGSYLIDKKQEFYSQCNIIENNINSIFPLD
tara:strand:- start:38534 stop:40336 length:1803 start_codon:yes stop_codon:yes gene_type:complete